MSNENYWKSIHSALGSVQKFINEMWNVWRWFGVAALGFGAYDATGNKLALIFAGLISVIGVVALFSWVFQKLIDNTKEKGQRSGRLETVVLTLLYMYLAIFFAVSIWALTMIFAVSMQK